MPRGRVPLGFMRGLSMTLSTWLSVRFTRQTAPAMGSAMRMRLLCWGSVVAPLSWSAEGRSVTLVTVAEVLRRGKKVVMSTSHRENEPWVVTSVKTEKLPTTT